MKIKAIKIKALIKISKNNIIFLLPILSGILLILAYPPYNWEFLVWVALIPLFWFIYKAKSNKSVFWGGISCGVVFFGKLFSWLFATYPFEWLGVGTKESKVPILILLIILWLIQTIFLALFVGFFAWLLKQLLRRLRHPMSWPVLMLGPALWILLEYLRSWGFGILYLGKESLLGPHWTFGNLAYTLHNQTNLIQIADIGGIYLISFLIMLVNTGLFLILKQCRRFNLRHIAGLVIILGLVGLVGIGWQSYGIYKINKVENANQVYKVALLQTNFLSAPEFNAYSKKEVFETLLNLFKSPEAIKQKADIVIAPEGFGIVNIAGSSQIAKYLVKDFYQPGQIYLENKKIVEKNTRFNPRVKSRLFFYDLDKKEPIGYHDKLLLVPNGDFLPYLTKALLNIYSFDIEHEKRLYNKGKKIEPIKNIGGTICSSIVSADIQRKITKKGAEFLAVVSSDAPFHGSKSLLAQNLAMSKLRAVENRRYFAQATNMGYSFLLNPRGKIVVKSNQLGNKILFANVQFLNKKTIYTKLGNWPVFLSTIILLLTIILWYNKKRNLL